MKTKLIEEIEEKLEQFGEEAIPAEISQLHPADIAEIMNEFRELVEPIFQQLEHDELRAEVLVFLPEEIQESLLAEMNSEQMVRLMRFLDPDDAADVLSFVEQDQWKSILQKLPEEQNRHIAGLLKYHEESAGGIMTSEVPSVQLDVSVGKTIEYIKENTEKYEDTFFVYVTDHEHYLKGIVDFRTLIIAPDELPISMIMNTDVVSVTTETDQEEVAQIAKKYDMFVVPVIDHAGHLMGRITIDDIIDVIEQEHDEDLSHLMGTADEEFEAVSTLKIARYRFPWLLTGILGEIISAFVMSMFGATLQQLIALSFFIPMIIATAGNVGIQSSSIVVRGLATGELDLQEAGFKIFQEIRIGLLNGVACGVLVGLSAYAWQNEYVIGLIVGVSMIAVILVAAFVGSFMPFVLKRFGVDPAVATGPFVTTSNDVLGLMVYLGLATYGLQFLG